MKKITIFAAMATLFSLSACVEDDVYGTVEKPQQPSTASKIYINEVCSGGTDWIELYNPSDKEASIAGFSLQDGNGAAEEYKLPSNAKIAAKGYMVLEKEAHFTFGISSNGDIIRIYNATGKLVDEIEVPALADGQTYARKSDGGAEWSITNGGTKGKSNGGTPSQGESNSPLLINEVINNPHDGGTDLIEIYNPGKSDIDISGYILQDDKGDAEQYIIPEATIIEAGKYMCFTQLQETNKEGSFGFGLSSKGDVVILLDNKGLTIDRVEVPAIEKGSSYVRISNAGSKWEITTSPTPGQSNDNALNSLPAAAIKGVIVINEIYTFSNQSEISDLDFIELYNTSDKEVDISGLKMWEGGGQAEAWIIPAGNTIPAKGYFVVECDKYGLYNDPINYPAWGLSKNDEIIVLADCGMEIIEQIQAPNMSTDEAYGRKTDGGEEWIIFAELTPGKSNNGAKEKSEVNNTVGVWINEVFTNNQDEKTSDWDETKDFIELYNATDQDIDISGYSLNDDALKEDKLYRLPAGTVIKAKSFLTLDVFKENTDGPIFGLGKGGDKVFLFDPSGNVVDEVVTPSFEKTEIYSTGRKTDGGAEIVVFTEISKNASNNGKAIKAE